MFRKSAFQEPIDCAIQTAAVRSDDHWSVEIRIPLAELNRAAFGAKWRFNLCRSSPSSDLYCSVFPTSGSFHNPRRFGWLAVAEDTLKVARRLAVADFTAAPEGLTALVRNHGEADVFAMKIVCR